MNIADLKPYSPITEREIIAFEKQISFELPEDYRSFLLMSNGGGLRGYRFYVDYLETEFSTDVFYGLGLVDGLNLSYWIGEYHDEIPEKTVLIGGDPGGIHLIYITQGEDKGIYIWDHAHMIPASDEEGNTYFIAESFEEFIKSLKKFIP